MHYFLLIWMFFAPQNENASAKMLVGQWIQLDGGWQHDEEVGDEWVNAKVLHICPGGEFTMMTTGLRKSKGKIMIDPSGGIQRFEGHWQHVGKSITVRYRFSDSMYILFPIGKGPDRSEKHSELFIKGRRIFFNKESYGRCHFCEQPSFGWAPRCRSGGGSCESE